MTGTVKVQCGELFYEVAPAKGPPLLLLHAASWASPPGTRSSQLLARTHWLIRYDERGHGRSPETMRTTKTCGIYSRNSHPTLVGLSLGARTALDYALAHPEMVEALVLVSPGMSGMTFGDRLSSSATRGSRGRRSRNGASVVEWFLRAWVDGPKRPPEDVSPAVRERLRRIAMANLPKQAALLTPCSGFIPRGNE